MYLALIEETLGKDDVQVRVAYRTRKTQSFFSNKDKVSKELQSNVIYSYDCDLCPGHKYIGETVRHFSTRKREHITGEKGPTEISSHVHLPKDSNFSIVTRTPHTLIAESLIYHTVPPALRLNKYHPPYELQIFNCDIYSASVINLH